MRYITWLMIICLFFTVKSEEETETPDVEEDPEDDIGDSLTCSFETEKACKESEKNSLTKAKCCWLDAKLKIGEIPEQGCVLIPDGQFDTLLKSYKATHDDVSLDCSGKYLYVASLLLLFFVF